jgi:hypothetical protein
MGELKKMAETKYGKYIITELKRTEGAPWSGNIRPALKGTGGRVLYLDNEILPGAFYLDCAWSIPGEEYEPDKQTKPHTHDYDEVLCFFGSNPEDFHDLGGEVEFWLGDEKHIITKSCIIFIPKGLKHSPLVIRRVDRPIFHFSTGPSKMYF